MSNSKSKLITSAKSPFPGTYHRQAAGTQSAHSSAIRAGNSKGPFSDSAYRSIFFFAIGFNYWAWGVGFFAYDQIVMSINLGGRWIINFAFLTSTEMSFFSFHLQKSRDVEMGTIRPSAGLHAPKNNEHVPLPLNSPAEN